MYLETKFESYNDMYLVTEGVSDKECGNNGEIPTTLEKLEFLLSTTPHISPIIFYFSHEDIDEY